jgi:hypothetical protein
LNSDTVTVFASASRTTTTTSSDFTNYGAAGANVFTRVSNIHGGTPSITVTIQGKDDLSGQYYTIITSAAITTVSSNRLRVAYDLTAGATIAKDFLPRTWRIVVTHADTQSITYSVAMFPQYLP